MTGRKAHTWMDGVNACLDVTGKNPKDDKPGKNPKDDKPGKKPKDDKPGKNPKDDKPGKNPKDDKPGKKPKGDKILTKFDEGPSLYCAQCGVVSTGAVSCCGVGGDWRGDCGTLDDVS